MKFHQMLSAKTISPTKEFERFSKSIVSQPHATNQLNYEKYETNVCG